MFSEWHDSHGHISLATYRLSFLVTDIGENRTEWRIDQ
jgi:hypothetical protein